MLGMRAVTKQLSLMKAVVWSGLLLVGLVAVPAGAVTYRDIVVTAEPLPRVRSGDDRTYHGYLEYQFVIANRSPDRDHVVSLEMPQFGGPAGQTMLESATITRQVPAASAIRVSLFQPAIPMGGSSVSVSVDGRRQAAPVRVDSSEHIPAWGYGGRNLVVLVTKTIADHDVSQLVSHLPYSLSVMVPEVPVAAWSSNWLGYSRYDAVILTDAPLRQMPDEVRQALIRYTEAGGCLMVAGQYDPPVEWQRQVQRQPGRRIYQAGFGRCIVAESIDRLLDAERSASANPLQQTTAPFENRMSVQGANNRFPIIDSLGIPVGGLFVLMLVFAMGIGPINLLLISRRTRRMWLLWTVPVVSLLTCFAVFAYAAFAEGWSGKQRCLLLTLLDESAQRATTIGYMAFYSPLTPGAGLVFDYETELTPQTGTNMHSMSSDGRGRSVDWTRAQHLVNGWIVARVPAHFQVRKSQVAQRQRIKAQRNESGQTTITNGLGVSISELYLADDAGQVYFAGDIEPGAQATIQPMPDMQAQASADMLRRVYSEDWLASIESIPAAPQKYLQPGSYLALTDQPSPFLQQGLERISEQTMQNLVIGLMKEPLHAR